MKQKDVLIIAGFAAGAYFLLTKGPAPLRRLVGGGTVQNSAGGLQTAYNRVNEVLNTAFPGQVGYGWKYYDDGVSIGPDGKYYLNGNLVWSPS